MSITLYTGGQDGPHKEFNGEAKNLYEDGTFKNAQVTSGTWFLYKQINCNKNLPGSKDSDMLILKEGSPLTDISSVNGSLYLLPDQKVGIVLFEHSYYGGARTLYDSPGCSDVTTLFPPGEVGGVSSTVVLDVNDKWDVFTKKSFKGLTNELLPGQYYATPAEMKFPNDAIQSIRKK